jgi:murein DD-endopeptidase MepM/ murein hydrolase activator NlpD
LITSALPLANPEEITLENYQDVPMVLNSLVSTNPPLTTIVKDLNFEKLAQTDSSLAEGTAPSVPILPESITFAYTVKDNDTLSSIAALNGISLNTLLWANNLTENSHIKSGQVLDIPVTSGVIITIKKGDTLLALVKKYKADLKKTQLLNRISDGNVKIGEKILLVNGAPPVVAPQTLPSQTQKAKSKTYTTTVKTAKAEETSASSLDFISPASGINHRVIHSNNGVDISNVNGGSISAAESGTVTKVVNGCPPRSDACGGGYGNHIVIQHANGVETLYAHNSDNYVQAGQAVSKGQVIASMGNTGRVRGRTGIHLHFEVHGAKNFLAY